MEITKEQLEGLKEFINTIPTQWGMPLMTFFFQIEQQQEIIQQQKVDEQPSESEEMDT